MPKTITPVQPTDARGRNGWFRIDRLDVTGHAMQVQLQAHSRRYASMAPVYVEMDPATARQVGAALIAEANATSVPVTDWTVVALWADWRNYTYIQSALLVIHGRGTDAATGQHDAIGRYIEEHPAYFEECEDPCGCFEVLLVFPGVLSDAGAGAQAVMTSATDPEDATWFEPLAAYEALAWELPA